MRPIVRIVTSIAVLLMFCASAQAADLLSGTWKLNVAKSKHSSPSLAPKSRTTMFQIIQNRLKAVVDGVDSKGRLTHWEYEVVLDGKDYPRKSTVDGKPSADGDAISCRKIDDYTYEFALKLRGQTLTTQRTVIAPDGKTRTNTVTGRNAQGQTVNNVELCEKQ